MTRTEAVVGAEIFVTLLLLHESRDAITVPVAFGLALGAIWLARILDRRERRRR
jgi:hypothetical protein